MSFVILDTSVVVGWLDARDSQHRRASELMAVLRDAGASARARLLMLDCVAVESVGVLCRRRAERASPEGLPDLAVTFPGAHLSRAYPLLDGAWSEMLAEVQSSDGRLNAHDALILHYARAERIPFVATFDGDLTGRGVTCLTTADEAGAAFRSV